MLTRELNRDKQQVGRAPRVILVLAAIASAVMPLPASFVDRWYSPGTYTLLQPVVTRTSNLVPIALLDVAVVIVVSALIFLAWRDVARRGWRLGSRRVAWRLAIWVASTYLAFLIAWG